MAQACGGNLDKHLPVTGIVQFQLLDRQWFRFRIGRFNTHLVQDGSFDFHVGYILVRQALLLHHPGLAGAIIEGRRTCAALVLVLGPPDH